MRVSKQKKIKNPKGWRLLQACTYGLWSNTRGHSDRSGRHRRRGRSESHTLRLLTLMPSGVLPFKKKEKKKDRKSICSKAVCSPCWLYLSDWSSGPKHFTIFSKNCWTVENHLIRETQRTSTRGRTHPSNCRSHWWKTHTDAHRDTKKQQLELVFKKETVSSDKETSHDKGDTSTKQTRRAAVGCKHRVSAAYLRRAPLWRWELCVIPALDWLTDWNLCSSLYSLSGARLTQAFHSAWNEAHAGRTGWAGFHQKDVQQGSRPLGPIANTN